jgi:hypothetical protein
MSTPLQRGRVGKGGIKGEGICKAAVIREHVVGDDRIRLELVGNGGVSAHPGGFTDIGAV